MSSIRHVVRSTCVVLPFPWAELQLGLGQLAFYLNRIFAQYARCYSLAVIR